MFLETHNRAARGMEKSLVNLEKAIVLAAEARRLGNIDLTLKATKMVADCLVSVAEMQKAMIDYNHGLCEALDQKLLEQ
jgi:hypothetical protein